MSENRYTYALALRTVFINYYLSKDSGSFVLFIRVNVANVDPSKSEWRGESAGGCANTPMWRHNPQFRLSPSKSGWVHITVEQEQVPGRELTHIGFSVVKLSDKEGLCPFFYFFLRRDFLLFACI